jgi:gliding motility-associated-like protein
LNKPLSHIVLIIAFLRLLIEGSAQQLDPPTFGCMQVALNGDVTLNWQPTTDPSGNFTQYDIYTSSSQLAGYSLVASPGALGMTNYVHSTVNTLTNNYYYYLQTQSTDGTNNFTSISSDTLSTIWLTATPGANGYAQLDWNSPFLPSYDVPDGLEYEVWREYPAGTWQVVQTMPFGVTSSNYEIIDVCSAYMSFYVKLTLPNGCYFTSNQVGNTFNNFAPPSIPIVTDVSIDHVLNRAVITWEPSASEDTDGYIIYKCSNGNTIIVDTVWGINSIQFTDLFSGSAVATGPVSYTVAAFDECYYGIPPSPNTSALGPCHTSVYLPQIGYAYCSEFVNFNWTAYDGWDDGVESYIIYHATAPLQTTPYADLVFAPFDTIPGNTLNYSYPIDVFDLYHCFYIVAVGSITDYHATSNYTRVETPYPNSPAYIYLGSASVLSQDSTMITLDIEPVLDVFEFKLERYDEGGENWDEVIVLQSSGLPTVDMPDSQLTTDVFSYEYRVITSNTCGVIVDTTNLGKTILLAGQSNQERLVNTLVWSAYEDWDIGVDVYRIHRRIGEDGPDEMIAELNGGAELFYEDDVSTLAYTDGTFCYWIEAVESPTSLGGHSSVSNQLCLSLKPVIWIPNAFVVDGYNRTFSPVISFANFTSYRIIIYSRWGDIMFQSEDISAPWDGTMNGKTVQEGAYTYYITVKDGEGRAYDKTGYVLLLVAKEK